MKLTSSCVCDERMNGRTDEQTNRQTDKRTKGQKDKRTNGQTDKRKISPFYRTSSPTGAAAQKAKKSPFSAMSMTDQNQDEKEDES